MISILRNLGPSGLGAIVVAGLLVCGVARPAASATYEELVVQAKAAGPNFDYAALRQAYADSPRYDGYNTDLTSLRPPLQKAFREGDCASAISQGQAILEKNYVFIEAHFILGVCHKRQGQAELGERHTAAARALFKSISESGDGKTPETAIVVISVAEEYTVLGVRGLKKVQQQLVTKNGHSYDLINTENESGGKVDVYFNIDRVMRWSTEQFGAKK